MTATIPTRLQTTKLKTMARHYTRMAVDGRREDANRFLAAGLTMLERGMDAGVDRDFLDDAARGLHDAMSNLDARMQRDMDEAGLFDEYACLDLSELDAIIARLK
jgi:hypothetical protein